MKCQSCDIHEALHYYMLPIYQNVTLMPFKQRVNVVMEVGKHLCSECREELAEKVQDMF